jgi:hypothetical protein
MRSVSGDAWLSPIEEVVDPNRQGLDVVASFVEGIACEERRPGWNCDGSAAKPKIVVFDFGGPVVGKGPFDAGARQPAAIRVAEGPA